MSQSSETTRRADKELFALGYPDGHFSNTYFTAQCAPGIGVSVWKSDYVLVIEMFPWGDDEWPEMSIVTKPLNGHSRYARYIMRNAKSLSSFADGYPYLKCSFDTDLLTIKCLIEEGINQCNGLLNK